MSVRDRSHALKDRIEDRSARTPRSAAVLWLDELTGLDNAGAASCVAVARTLASFRSAMIVVAPSKQSARHKSCAARGPGASVPAVKDPAMGGRPFVCDVFFLFWVFT